MGECHRCCHREAIEAGMFRSVAFENTPCWSCRLVEKSAFTMAFDENRPGAVTGRPCEQDSGEALVEDVHFPEEVPNQDDMMPLSVMSEAMAQLLGLRPAVRDVVCWRFGGKKYGEIASVQGITPAGVESRLRRAMLRWPALRALFAEKAAKQKRRKPHGRRRPLRIQHFSGRVGG